jgi:hypothetical protein
LGPEWATEARNIVIDTQGRLSARKGWAPINGSQIESGAAIVQLHEYINASGTVELISTTATKLYAGTTTPTDKTGSVVCTDGNWKFVNFNGYCLGWKTGETPIQYNGSGNFATISVASGTLPDGSTALAAFGRVWAVDDDKQTIRYSALLDHTRWDVADGGGSIDMRSVWAMGMDEVVAIVPFGSNLVVFGKRHIVIWADGSGSQLGLSPVNMYVTDSIEGIGAVARDAVVNVGEADVVFWSEAGIRSLARAVQERATPVNDISPANRNYIANGKSAATLSNIRSAYYPQEGLVLFTAPALDLVFGFDVRQKTPDGGLRMIEWSLDPGALTVTVAGLLYMGFPGEIGLYSVYDDDGASYQWTFETGWVDLAHPEGGQGRKQALKAVKTYLYSEAVHTLNVSWGVDFGPMSSTYSVTAGQETTVAEWNEAEWGIGEWGAAGSVTGKRVPLTREAEYFKLRLGTTIDGTPFAIQPLAIYSKPMRLA